MNDTILQVLAIISAVVAISVLVLSYDEDEKKCLWYNAIVFITLIFGAGLALHQLLTTVY